MRIISYEISLKDDCFKLYVMPPELFLEKRTASGDLKVQVLISDMEDFTLCPSNDGLHCLYKDSRGCICLLQYKGGEWIKGEILQLKDSSFAGRLKIFSSGYCFLSLKDEKGGAGCMFLPPNNNPLLLGEIAGEHGFSAVLYGGGCILGRLSPEGKIFLRVGSFYTGEFSDERLIFTRAGLHLVDLFLVDSQFFCLGMSRKELILLRIDLKTFRILSTYYLEMPRHLFAADDKIYLDSGSVLSILSLPSLKMKQLRPPSYSGRFELTASISEGHMKIIPVYGNGERFFRLK